MKVEKVNSPFITDDDLMSKELQDIVLYGKNGLFEPLEEIRVNKEEYEQIVLRGMFK
jgi:hypothetical protein